MTLENEPRDLSVKDIFMIDGSFFDYTPDQKQKILGFIEENEFVLKGLDSLKKEDGDIGNYKETLKVLFDLVATEMIEPSQLKSLVLGFLTKSSADTEMERYGFEGVAAWQRYEVILFDKLFERDSEGKMVQDVAHNMCHELGHSVIELAGLEKVDSLEPLLDALSEIEIQYDTSHVRKCKENGVDEATISKERMAEVLGSYLSSGGKQETFLSKRAEFFPLGIDEEKIALLLDKNRAVFRAIDALWPNIKKQLSEVDLNEVLISSPLVDGEGIELESGMRSSSAGGSFGPEGPSRQTGNSPSFKETGSLGSKEKHEPGYFSLVTNLIQAMSHEVQIVKD